MAADIRPSSLPHLALCPRWQSSPESTPAASRGTELHAEIAAHINARTRPDLATDDARAVCFALDVVDALRAEFPDHLWRAEVPTAPAVLGVAGGAADLVGVDPWDDAAPVVVVDWKSGWGDHGDAASSLQLLAYALGAKPDQGERARPSDTVLMLVDIDKRQATRCFWTRADLESARSAIRDVQWTVETATDDDRRPSHEACRYCARAATCSAARSMATSIDTVALEELDVDDMDGADVAAVLDILEPRAKLAATILAALTERARRLLADGATVPGWTLKPGSNRRQWAAEPAEVFRMVAGAGIEVDLTDLVTPAEAEKRLTKALGNRRGDGRAARDVLAPLIVCKQAAPSVVRAGQAGAIEGGAT